MPRITLGPEIESQLNASEEVVEVCNQSGRILGYFLSKEEYFDLVYARADSQISEEELERRMQEPGVRTTVEVLERLGRG
jgi:hypothetical protein